MKVMDAMTPTERANKRVADLMAVRERIDAEVRDLLAYIDERPVQRRSRLVVPECGTETAYQRHAHSRDTSDGKRRVTCEPCLEAHRVHERVRLARARLREAS